MALSGSKLALLIICLLGILDRLTAQNYTGGQYVSETSLFGVTYSPLALDLDEICLPPTQVEFDMEIIKEVTDHLRLYSLAVCPGITRTILRRAEEFGMRVIIGLYLSEDGAGNRAEVEAVAPTVREYGDIIDAVIVGNEVLFLEVLTLEELLEYIEEVKDIILDSEHSTIPVTTAEVWPVYESVVAPRIGDAIDFLCLNIQPFWEGWDVICPTSNNNTGGENECVPAGTYVHLKAEGLESFYGKPVWICESGWPTIGERCCQGRPNARDGLLAGPSELNLTIYLSELVEGGREDGRPTYIHTIFDEDWKRIWAPCGFCEGLSTMLVDPFCDSCELDYHWGIYNFQREQKQDVRLPVAPSPE